MNAPRPLVAAINAVLLAGFAGDALATVDTTGLVYTPITPCRIVDTRVTGTPFAAKETRTFQTNGAAAQGGGACTVYSGTIPSALSLNVTVDATSLGSPAQSGYLNLLPQNGTNTSWMNFVGGQTVANAGVASINQGDGSFSIKTQNPANVVVDVFGYFSQGPAGATGAIGATGPTGDIGTIGATGPKGDIGPTGATGLQGLQGAPGLTGATGTPGATGQSGIGVSGATGATGATGPVFTSGVQLYNVNPGTLFAPSDTESNLFTQSVTYGNSPIFGGISTPLVVPLAGAYRISYSCPLQTSFGTFTVTAQVTRNGTSLPQLAEPAAKGSSSSMAVLSADGIALLNASDSVQLVLQSTSDFFVDEQCSMAVVYLSP